MRSAVLRNLERTVAEQVIWSHSKVPTIRNVDVLRCSRLFTGAARGQLLEDFSVPSGLEGGPRAATVFLAGLAAKRPRGAPVSSLAEMAESFQTHVLPMAQQPGTRVQQWLHWRAVITLAVAHDFVDQLVPMTKQILMAISWQLLTLNCNPGHVQAVWASIAQRHRALNKPAPLAMRGEYSAWAKAINNISGRPHMLKFPLGKELIHRMLSIADLRIAPYVVQRSVLATVLATVCCARVSEIANLQACDVLFDFDTKRGLADFRGTAAIRISKRKNDTLRKGLFPRIGRACNPTFDIVAWLRAYQLRFGLQRAATCRRGTADRDRCDQCPPLFVLTSRQGRATLVTHQQCSRQHVSDAIRQAIDLVGAPTDGFSGISARKGGLSTAIEAGVPEWVLFMQSGHGQQKAARAYMALDSQTFLFDTWAAFNL